MGVIYSIFKKNEYEDVVVDFENAKPTPENKDLYDRICRILEQGPSLLELVEKYEACSELIRTALRDASQENEDVAFEMVSSNANQIHGFWSISKELEQVVPEVFSALGGDSEEKTPVVGQQALAYKLADIFDFVLRFDELKMLRPGLQNDFAFYRRALPKHSMDPNLLVGDEDASFISMFLANPNPMMASLCKAMQKAVANDENSLEQVVNMGNACCFLIRGKKFGEDSPNNYLCARAMTACIILYDNVSQEGAFAKSSKIHVKSAAQLLTKDFMKDFPSAPDTLPLANLIRYSCPHFDDPTTPSSVASMFENI